MSNVNFCDLNNIQTCIQILSGELEVLGFNSISFLEGKEKECIVDLVNNFWLLVHSNKKQVLKINGLNEKQISLSRKIVSLEGEKEKYIFQVENERKKLSKLDKSLYLAQEEIDKLRSELRELKQELASVQLSLSHQQLQFEHDIRKKESQIEELQNKLFKLTGAENEIKSSKSVSKEPEVIIDESISRKYLVSLQDNIQLILKENNDLRSSIVHIYLLFSKERENSQEEKDMDLLFKLPHQRIVSDIERGITQMLRDS